jgi:putative ABC transport system permease protein
VTGLALRSLRHRPAASLATFLAALLGTALMGSFATLVATAGGDRVSDTDAETLVVMGAVVGGWGALIVLFSVASTVAITVRQQHAEIGLLRTVGATPRQAGRLVRAQAVVAVLLGSLVGAAVATIGGRALLSLLRGGLVSDDVAYAGGAAPLVAAAAVVLASLVATAVAARRATRGPARLVVAGAGAPERGLRWWRALAAVLLVGYGIATAVVTITVTADSDDPYAAMQTSGSSSILVGLGLALLAPVLLRWGTTLLRPLLGLLLGRGAVAHLATWNTARRAHLLSGVLAPVIVLVAAAVGVLMLVGIDGRTLDASLATEEADTITLLNNVVVGMIVVFAAIMVANAVAAAVADRRAELDRLRLLGATPAQVRGSVVAESLVVAVVGILAGAVASLATVVPFAVARDEGLVPDGQLWLPPLVLAATLALTVGATRVAAGRAVR